VAWLRQIDGHSGKCQTTCLRIQFSIAHRFNVSLAALGCSVWVCLGGKYQDSKQKEAGSPSLGLFSLVG